MSPFWRAFARYFVPSALLVLGGAWLLAAVERGRQLDEIKSEQRLAVTLGTASLGRSIQNLARDLDFIARGQTLSEVARHPDPASITRLEEDFLNLLRAKPIYDQIRWIDAAGQEILRVDLTPVGPRARAASELQNKADRYYFKDTIGGIPGRLFMSPLDLNIEHGQIEQPLKPMLRLATPLGDGEGRARGILVLNYLGADLLRRFETVTQRFGRHFMLVDQAGYWLHAPDPADAWGFMYQDATRSLAHRHSASWQRMAGESGQFEDGDGLWTYEAIHPLRVEGHTLYPMGTVIGEPSGYRWWVVSRLPPEQLAAQLSERSAAPWGYALALLALLAGGSAALVRVRSREAASQRRFHAIFNHAMVGMGTVGPDLIWLSANPALCAMLGYGAEELAHLSWLELTHPDDRASSLAQFESTRRGEQEGYSIKKRYLRKDGGVIHTAIAAHALRKPNGELDYFVVIVEDISDRHAYETRLALLVRRAAALLELPRQADVLSEAALLDYALGCIRDLTGSPVGRLCLLPPGKRGGGTPPLASPLIANTLPADTALPPLPADFHPATRCLHVPVLEGGEPRLLLAVGDKAQDYDALDVETTQLIGNDTWRLIERQRAERALRAAMEVVNASPVVCFRWRAAEGWPVEYVSDNVRQWGYEPADLLRGEPRFADLVHPDDLARVSQEVRNNTAAGLCAYEQEYRLITSDDRVIWVLDRTTVQRLGDGRPAFYDGVLTDITERTRQQTELTEALTRQRQLNKRLEDANNQLLQSEKMASIGQLAAGVAHELNNPIGFVHSNLGTLDSYLRDIMTLLDAYEKVAAEAGEDSRAALERLRADLDFAYLREDIFNLVTESKDGLARVKKIVQDLKSFSRVGETEWKFADLHQGLDSTLNIVWNELKYKCEVIKDYGDIPQVYCLISQLNQVFMNLLVNASHAIDKHGSITIRTRRHLDDQVCVEITDTGSGIAPEHLNRIFEPFFTTKPVGKGTGLGLSLAYGIVERHRGRIAVDSQIGTGTTFRIYLPIQPATPLPDGAAPPPVSASGASAS